MIRIRDLVIQVDGTRLLHGISMDVSAGEWVAVIGPNGAGKSTLCRGLVGLLAPALGSIAYDGREAAAMSRRDRARLVAYVPQSPALPAGFTVADYVLLGRTPYVHPLGTERPADRQAMTAAIDRLGLRPFARRELSTLSGGERQRVLIARALAQSAPILLLDEPTTALDIGAQQEVLDLLDRLRAESGLTVVTTLHDLTLAGQYADRLVLLYGGRIVAEGEPSTVLTEENLERYYGARMRVVYEHGRPVILPVRGPVPVQDVEAG